MIYLVVFAWIKKSLICLLKLGLYNIQKVPNVHKQCSTSKGLTDCSYAQIEYKFLFDWCSTLLTIIVGLSSDRIRILSRYQNNYISGINLPKEMPSLLTYHIILSFEKEWILQNILECLGSWIIASGIISFHSCNLHQIFLANMEKK